jgi:transcription elongation factor GreA
MAENKEMTMGEAVANYVAGLADADKESSQAELQRLAKWFGRNEIMASIKAEKVDQYSESLPTTDKDYARKMEIAKGFLTYARDQHWTGTNLSIHIKPKKNKSRRATGKAGQSAPEVIPVTEEGYAKLKAELEDLKQKRPQIIDEITKAAADKDFRENAPLEAAREQHGLIEGRIKEIEAILKAAEIVVKQKAASHKVNLGDTVILVEMETNTEMCYKIVGPRETDPSKGKISGVSPVGKAVVGSNEGQTVEVCVPIGKIKYQIKQIVR